MAEVDRAQISASVLVRQNNIDRERQLVVGPHDLPRIVTELVDLGPRPYEPTSDAILMPLEVLDGYAGSGAPSAALEELAELFVGVHSAAQFGALLGPDSVRWRLEVDGARASDEPQASLDVIDAGPGGLWLLTPADLPGYAEATPISSTAAWLLLGQLAADAAELSSITV